MEKPLKIYFAGDLFDAKDLGGNLLLAGAIERVSEGRYEILLPQEGECEVRERSAESIRDADFELLFKSDLILANFDGADLDSGTVAEFCFAKMLDMPALLLRTDFRDCGDKTLPDGDPWNLMCSRYPRTRTLWLNAMVIYHDCKAQGGRELLAERFYNTIACEVVKVLDELVSMPPRLAKEDLGSRFDAILESIGGKLAERFPAPEKAELIKRKKSAGLY